MPNELLNKMLLKVNSHHKVAFISAVIFGFAVYIYMFTNRFLNHDGLDSLYHDQNVSSSGRFVLSYAAGISSYFELPIIIGILSVLYLAIISSLIVDIFEIKNKFEIILLSGIIVTFPTIGATFSYLFTADAYLLGYVLSILSIYLIIKYKNAIYFSWIILFLAIGIYQATISLFLVIGILFLIKEILLSKGQVKEIYQKFLRLLGTFIVAMISYVIIFKIYQSLFGITDYQGIDQSGNINLYSLLLGVVKTIQSFGGFYFKNFILYQEITLFEILNAVTFALVFCTIILVIYKLKLKAIHKLFTLVLIISIPFASFIIYFISPTASYHTLMMYSLVFLYLSALLLYIHVFSLKKYTFISWITVIVLSLSIFNNAVIANIGFLNAELKMERSKALMNRVLTQAEMQENFKDAEKILILGSIKMNSEITSNIIPSRTPYMTGTGGDHSLNDQQGIRNFIELFYGYDLKNSSEEELENIKTTPTYKQMEAWPSENAIKVIDNILVINFNEEE